MTQQALDQIIKAWKNGDPMAELVIGIMALEGRTIKQNYSLAIDSLGKLASNNILWAQSIYQYIQDNIKNPNFNCYVTKCLSMPNGALGQIADYGNRNGNMFAWTIVGSLMLKGEITPQNQENAVGFLNAAVKNGCLWARDFVNKIKNPADEFRGVFSGHGVPVSSDRQGNNTTSNSGNTYPSNSNDPNIKPDNLPDIIDDVIISDGTEVIEYQKKDTNHDYMKELNDLIGLARVKKEIEALRNFVIVQRDRKSQGLRTIKVSYHCVFSGSPGTGKTTVARIVAGIYKELGILRGGQLIETQRSDFVAEYEGQTAVKTNRKIDEALDGVLFIDEAYTLNGGDQDQYGKEAINTLLKRMEDDRDRLVVIIAGYSNEIRQFVNTNSGLESRFNRYIHFEDYTAEELIKIFDSNLRSNQFKIKKAAHDKVYEIISDKVRHKDGKFGNARYVRNLFEKIIQSLYNRIANYEKRTKEDLSVIEFDDVVQAIHNMQAI